MGARVGAGRERERWASECMALARGTGRRAAGAAGGTGARQAGARGAGARARQAGARAAGERQQVWACAERAGQG